MKASPFLLVLAVLAASLLAAPSADAQEPVTVVVTGPTAVAPDATHPYKITVTGGPAAESNGTFEITYELLGDNLDGADPRIPRLLANDAGTFEFNVTSPSAEGFIQLFVKATSRAGDRNETAEGRLSIEVARPIDLRVTLRNNGAATATNVTVKFYVDGRFVGETRLARINAGESVEASFSFIPTGMLPGRHTVRVEADLDRDGVIGPGELVVTDFFYKTERSVVPAILGTITLFLLFLLGIMFLAIRRQRRQGTA